MGRVLSGFGGSSIPVLIAAAALAVVPVQAAQAAEPRVAVAVSAGALDRSLMSLAAQARVRILFESQLVAGRTAPAVRGQFTAREALERLLAGSNIEILQARPGVLVLRSTRIAISNPSPASPQDQATAAAMADPAAEPQQGAPSSLPAAETEPTTTVSEIVVGTHIRGAKSGASPVIVIGRDEIDRGGHATVADALSAMPQVFGGSASDDTGTTGVDTTGTNAHRATGVNLRGLGADATLVLINGRRMAGAGIMGDFADVSGIPLAAVERVEVLLDGASALYGSDAVGGVVNIVMRDHYDGAETRARVGGSTHGDLGQRQVAQTFGHAWRSGSLLVSGEYQRRDRLRALDRPFTANADLRDLGGGDHRVYFSQPGNVLAINPATSQLAPAWAIPGGQDGTHLAPGDLLAGQRNLQNQNAVMDILPAQERGSLYVAASQDVGASITLTADLRYSDRRYTSYGLAPTATLTVGRNNPFFVSPNGAATNTIAYSFGNETGGQKLAGEAQSRGLSIGAKMSLPADWRLDLYGVHAEEIGTSLYTNELNSAFLGEALGNTADNPLTAYSAARDGYLNPYIGQGRNRQAVLDFVTGGFDTRRTIGRLDTASATADGPLWRLPAGQVRLALGAQVRTETLKTTGLTMTTTVAPVAAFSRRGDRTVTALFAELRAPLFGEDFRRPGLERLELSAAVRREHYDSGATSTVPKVGLVWAPVDALNLKATYGESFRAPSLGELHDPQGATPLNIRNGSATVLSLLLYGGNPDLKPETAKSWTAGIEYAPRSRPDLRLSATLFDTKFENRISRPAINNLSTVLTAPDLAPFRTFVSPGSNPSDLALIQALLKNATAVGAALYAPTAYQAIADGRYVNAGVFQVRGLDLTGSYRLRVHDDPLTLSGNLSWLMSYKRKTTVTAQSVELTGMAGNPADLRARLSSAWSHGPLTTTASLNHTGDLHDEAGRRIAAQTTADLQVQYAPWAQPGAWRGLAVALTVQNLFDQDPPFYEAPQNVGYDPANYEPGGRVVALQLTKAW
jgi:outer membrane receptor protein involved in Fe transport